MSLIILLSGSELTVNGGKNLAIALGVSNTVIGLTLVAIGTSLPELAASFSALRRKKRKYGNWKYNWIKYFKSCFNFSNNRFRNNGFTRFKNI